MKKDDLNSLTETELLILVEIGKCCLLSANGIYVGNWISFKGAMWYFKENDTRIIPTILNQLNGSETARINLQNLFLNPQIRKIVDKIKPDPFSFLLTKKAA